MLVIRKSQFKILLAPQRDVLVECAVRSLAKVFPDDPRLGDQAATRALVRNAIDRASRYGIESERDVLLFVYLVFDQGPGFESRPGQTWIERILRAPGLDTSQKMDLIYTRLELAAKRGRP